MPPDDVLREVRGWFRKAESDLRNIALVMAALDPPLDTVCFHAQYAESLIMRSRAARREEMARSLGKLSAPVPVDNFA